MLDADLAAIYGYSTKDFNRQVKNNIEKFDDDFMFQLTDEECDILRCKNSTSSWGGRRYNPFAFTEQGIYHCGASSKDGGNKVTTITAVTDGNIYHSVIDQLLQNPTLVLR